jgi:hypothetical protein
MALPWPDAYLVDFGVGGCLIVAANAADHVSTHNVEQAPIIDRVLRSLNQSLTVALALCRLSVPSAIGQKQSVDTQGDLRRFLAISACPAANPEMVAARNQVSP